MKKTLEKSDALAARPVRLVDAAPAEAGAGKWRLAVPLKPAKWTAWLLRVPPGTTKMFELDPLGKFVWDECDGRTTVKQIIHRLARQYNLNEREAEVATVAFLHTLAKKGLVGMAMKKPQRESSVASSQ